MPPTDKAQRPASPRAEAPSLREIRTEFRDWLTHNLPSGWLEGNRVLPEGHDALRDLLRDWLRRLGSDGWLAPHWPQEYGGRGLGYAGLIICLDELARVEAPPNIGRFGANYIGPTLMSLGTDAQKRRYLPAIASGQIAMCQAFSEPEAGSDLASLRLSAKKAPDGSSFLLTGEKIWTSYAQFSDCCLVLARTGPTIPKHEGITAMIVDLGAPEIDVRPIRQMTGRSEFNQIHFNGAVVRADDVLGPVDDGWRVAMHLLQYERIGTADAVFPLLHRLRRMRTDDAGGMPLITGESARDQWARLYARSLAARAVFDRFTARWQQDATPTAEGSILKLLATEVDESLSEFGLRLVRSLTSQQRTGSGDSWPDYYAKSISVTVAGGASEIQRDIVAGRVLKLPRRSAAQ